MPQHRQSTDELVDAAALYALGLLSESERSSMDQHLSEGCVVCESEIGRCGDLLAKWAEETPVAAPPALRRKLLQSLREKQKSLSETGSPIVFDDAGLLVLRTTQMEWQSPSPGFSVKVLLDDSERDVTTSLVRMAPGTLYPAHRHKGIEEVYVLQGDLRVEGVELVQGDYCLSQPETIHQGSYSELGCLLMVKTSKHDEVLR
jgi:quercetin dioxygenase-like cupin family protein